MVTTLQHGAQILWALTCEEDSADSLYYALRPLRQTRPSPSSERSQAHCSSTPAPSGVQVLQCGWSAILSHSLFQTTQKEDTFASLCSLGCLGRIVCTLSSLACARLIRCASRLVLGVARRAAAAPGNMQLAVKVIARSHICSGHFGGQGRAGTGSLPVQQLPCAGPMKNRTIPQARQLDVVHSPPAFRYIDEWTGP